MRIAAATMLFAVLTVSIACSSRHGSNEEQAAPRDGSVGGAAARDGGAAARDGGAAGGTGSGGRAGTNMGGRAAAGTGGDGGSDAGATPMPGDDGGALQHPVGACDALQPAGTWENVTPELAVLPGNAPCPYGGAFAMNPQDPAELFLGSCNQGIWKSSDCGATWAHINTGKNGALLDGGRQWTFAIDPTDPRILYANSGYGSQSNGAFKSINGGVDWEPLWPPADADQAKIVEYNFVAQVVLDPDDSKHLLITFHAKCAAPHPEACFGESNDAGATWRIVDGQSDWAGGEGQAVYFLENSRSWLWGSQSNGLWRSADSGGSWQPVTDKQAQGHGAGQMYRSKSGVFYLPVLNGILRSDDGITWDIVPNSGSIMNGMTGSGTTMWASRGFPWDPSTNLYEPFWSSPENDGITWTQMSSPMLSNGGQLAYDAHHHLLYASNLGAGFWRVVTE